MKDSFPQFTRYKIESRLSQGGMGAIYVAKHIELDRQVALKVPFMTSGPELVERFVREGKMLAKLDHPNIVRVYDAESENGSAFIAMALIEGKSLDQYLLNDLPPIEKTVKWAISLSDALAHIHARDIFHRDIKTANIIIDSMGRPVLVDFGISLDDQETRLTLSAGQFIGTLRYASPESLNGDPQKGRSDIYSFGVVLYECLSGAFPYESNDVKSFIVEVMRGSITPLEERRPDLPDWLTKIVGTCLQIKPEKRFASAHQLNEALRAGLLSGDTRRSGRTILSDAYTKDFHAELPDLEPIDSGTPGAEQEYSRLDTVERTEEEPVYEAPLPDITKTAQRDAQAQEEHVYGEDEPEESIEHAGGSLSSIRNVLIGGVLLVGLVVLFMVLNPFASSSSGQTEINVSPIIQELVDLEPAQMEGALRDLRMQGRVIWEKGTGIVESPEKSYLILVGQNDVLAILTPANAEGIRTDILTETLAKGDLESLFGPVNEVHYVLLLDEEITG